MHADLESSNFIKTFDSVKLFKRMFVIAATLFLSLYAVMAGPIDDGGEKHYHRFSKRDTSGTYKSPWSGVDWNALGRQSMEDSIKKLNQINQGRAKNVIMFLGDGMGLPTIAAARLYQTETRNLKREDTYLPWERFPFGSLSRTYNVDRSTPDSAGTATAYLCGIKANMGTIGVNENVNFQDCTATKGNEVKSIVKHSMALGKWTGVVTTTRITHASPAGCYANTACRDWEASVPSSVPNGDQCNDIAYQLANTSDNLNIKVILGGGVSYFISKNETDAEYNKPGLRVDNRNLINNWKSQHLARNDKFAFVKNRQELYDLDLNNTDYVMGLFQTGHMSYEADRNKTREPSLSEMTEKAIKMLSRGPNGYFLFIEGGRIDHSHHDTVAFKALNDTIAFADAVQRAVDLTNSSETLIVVTADHSHVFSVGGYAPFEESVFGFGDITQQAVYDNKPFLQLMYANGPGFDFHRNMYINGSKTPVEVPRKHLTGFTGTNAKNFAQDTGIWMDSESHGGEDVGVYASGPMAHLFHAPQEQSYIAHVMMYASCVGAYQNEKHCVSSDNLSSQNNSGKLAKELAIIIVFISAIVSLLAQHQAI